MTFQMTFAIITPALIVGAFAERMKFSALLLFRGVWLTIVDTLSGHWVGGGGWLGDYDVMDFAGGRAQLVATEVEAGGLLVGQQLRTLKQHMPARSDARVAAIYRDGHLCLPRGNTVI